MANVEAQGMKSFGVWLGHEGASNAKLVDAWKKVSSVKPAKIEGVPLPSGNIDAGGNHDVYDLHSLSSLGGQKRQMGALI